MGDTYLMGRNQASSNRLTGQHLLWKDHFGWNLHPNIQTCWAEEGEKERWIADIATGNGIWLIDILPSFQPASTTFVGLDISPLQFPHPTTLPKNLTFSTYNLYHPPPAELENRFSAINVRLLVTALTGGPGQVVTILKRIQTMLVPGGFLQWGEVDPGARPTVPPGCTAEDEEAALAAHLSFFKIMMSRHDINWIDQLPALFAEAGFEDVVVVRPDDPRLDMRGIWWNFDMGAAFEAVQMSKNEELARAWDRTAEFKDKGVIHAFPKLYVVGRKRKE